MNNMRQIYSGMAAYLQDNNNRMMQRFYPSQGVGYHEVLLPYVGNEPKVFVCRARNSSLSLAARLRHELVLRQPVALLRRSAQQDDPAGRVLRRKWRRIDPRRSWMAFRPAASTTSATGLSNYLFFDGHVQSLKLADTKKPLYKSQMLPGMRSRSICGASTMTTTIAPLRKIRRFPSRRLFHGGRTARQRAVNRAIYPAASIRSPRAHGRHRACAGHVRRTHRRGSRRTPRRARSSPRRSARNSSARRCRRIAACAWRRSKGCSSNSRAGMRLSW